MPVSEHRRCPSCGGKCAWHDEAWVCGRCGDEFYELSPDSADPSANDRDDFAPLTTRERAFVAAWSAEVERLRGIIGRLYEMRGKSRWELYLAIKRAFRESELK